jgi:hypothetical protein
MTNKSFTDEIIRIYTVCKSNDLFSWRNRDMIISQMVDIIQQENTAEYKGKLDIQE